MTTVLKVVLLSSSGIFAGALVLVASAIVPIFRELPASAYVHVHQTLNRRADRFMPMIALLTILVGLALTWLHSESVRAFLVIGVLLTLAVACISRFGNVPLNRKLSSWNPEAPPPEIKDFIERWHRLHLLRTIAGVLALGVFSLAVALQHA